MQKKRVPTAEPVLVAPPKSRGRRRAEIAVWSLITFWLYFYYRVKIIGIGGFSGFIRYFLSPSFQASSFHIPDYSLGFLPRVLSGQLLTLFAGGSVTGPAAGAYFLILYVVTYGLLSLVLGMLIEKTFSAKNYLMAMFPLFIIFTPPAVWDRSCSAEFLDIPMFLFALAAFLLINNEKLMWFVPVCVCLGIMTSESFMLLFFPLIFALLYYEFIKGGMKRTRLYTLITTTISSFALEMYMQWAVLHSELVSKYSFEESIAYLERKAGRVFTEVYVSVGVFGKLLDGQKISFFNMAINGRRFEYFKPIYYVIALLICAPILIFTLTIWRGRMKGEKGFWKKSPYMLFMLAPAIIFPGFFVFGDMDRLVSAVLLTQVLLLAYAFFADGQNEAFMRLKEISTGNYRWLLYAAVLFSVIVPLMVFRSPNWLTPTYNPAPLENMIAR